jgi:DtxR family Mn-dependent transcriptional regulator
MPNPAQALLIFTSLVAAVLALFWPRRGLAARLVRLLRMTERVRIEDALKHLYKGEHFNSPRTIESLAGALEVSRARAVQLLAHLEHLGLARSGREGMRVTSSGRDYALRIIRTHRLWERYLADETGVAPAEWHDIAEEREHKLTAQEVEQLAANMGNPLFDPHGDPIPTAAGYLPPAVGVALSALQPGDEGTIVHLEDEPREVFEKIVAAGLAPLTRVRVLAASPDGVRFEADGDELVLEPVVAGQVTVELLRAESGDAKASSTLADLRPGESATVVRISRACQGRQRRRLLDLGLVPGTVVSAELDSATHDPVGYRIRGALIALRRPQAAAIYVDRGSGALN